MSSRRLPLLLWIPLLVLLLGGPGHAEEESAGDAAKQAIHPAADWPRKLPWRSIGPAHMGGRITSLAVSTQDPTRWFAATASGGLLRTVNNGITFEHLFDDQKTVSIGDVAVAATNHDIVWVGTGEANPRNSVSWGNGVYKSIDGGKTFAHMGLEKSFQISTVRIHPKNPDVVYVGALGRLWGESEQRGLFKTTDGGKTWKRMLYVDAKTGVIDICQHPLDPETFLVATYERQRDLFDTNDPAKKWGPGSGLWRTTDGGASFEKVTKGLPTCAIGRVGLDWSQSAPDVVYAVVESERIGSTPKDSPYLGLSGAKADAGARITRVVKDGPSAKAGLKENDVVIQVGEDRVISYTAFIRAVRQHKAGETIPLRIVRGDNELEIDLTLGTWPQEQRKKEAQVGPYGRKGPFAAFLGGQRHDLQDQQGEDGHEYGGVYRSGDAGQTWTRVNSLNPRPMYFSEIRVDPNDDQRLWVLGVRLWRSQDGGTSFTNDGHDGSVHVDHHALWIDPSNSRHMILGNDGGMYVTYDGHKTWDHLNHVAIGQFYHVGVGPRPSYFVYGGMQDNGSWGGPIRVRDASGPRNDDWFRIGGGDGFRCLVDPEDPDQLYFTSQNGGLGRRHLEKGARASMRPRPPKGTKYRFNWYTPFLLSNHNSRIYYVAGNHVFRSLDRGDGLRAISPEISHTKRGAATALAESPKNPDLLYVGTDDGALHLTRDGGRTWIDCFAPPQDEATPRKPVAKPPHAASEGSGGDGDGKGSDEQPAKPDDKPAEDKPTEDKPAGTSEDGDAPEPPADDGATAEERAIYEKLKEAVDAKQGAGAPGRAGKAASEDPQGVLSPRAKRLLARDANGDGVLQKDELPGPAGRLFARGDKNKDGVLDVAELKALFPATQETKKPKYLPGKPLATLVPADRRYVSWLEASRFEESRVYLVLDAHRSDDETPFLFVSEDAGATWRSLVSNLPEDAGTTRVLCEDLRNPDLLYLGTEFGAYVSLDRGAHWTSLGANLPTVAVHGFAQHEASGDLVAATHGRSLWVMDVTPLRQMKGDALAKPVHLFAPPTAYHWRPLPGRGSARGFRGSNPPNGAVITYSFDKPKESVRLVVSSVGGKVLRELDAPKEAGLHQFVWDLRRKARRGRGPGPRVEAGTYEIKLIVDEEEHKQTVKVGFDPEHPDPVWVAGAELDAAEAAARAAKRAQRHAPYSGDD
jgi:photosystem II stability/assembly factor-like uncharacterized protein